VLVAQPGPTVELAVPNAVFGTPFPNLLRGLGSARDWYSVRDWYQVQICSGELDQARQPVGSAIDASCRLELLVMADTIIVVAGPEIPGDPRPEVRHALQQARARQTRIVAGRIRRLRARRSRCPHWSARDGPLVRR
jgi:hypothetical protein